MSIKYPYNLLFAVLAIFISIIQLDCTKPSDIFDKLNIRPGPFSVTVTMRAESSASIEWSKADDPDGDTVRYTIVLDGKKIDSNLLKLQYQFTNLLDDKEYKGSVIAIDPKGDTSMADFILPPFEGWLFGATPSGLGCVSLSTGTVKWDFVGGGHNGSLTPILVNDTLFAIGSLGQVYALNSRTGSLIWKTQLPLNLNYPAQEYSSPAYENGKIIAIVGSDSTGVFALRSSDGNILWSYKAFISVQSNPTIVNNIAYFSANNHKMYALDMMNGSTKWVYDTNVNYDLISSPTVVGNLLYFGSYFGNKLYALNAETGVMVWRFNASASINFSPRVENNVLYVASEDGKAYAFNARSGQVIWQSYLTNGDFVSNPSIDDNNVYFGCGGDSLVAMRKSDGQRIWTSRTYDLSTGAADYIPANGRVFVQGLYNLYQLSVANGEVLNYISRKPSQFILLINKKIYYPSSSGMLQ
jgi:outer membrane protein assembly factor BamB